MNLTGRHAPKLALAALTALALTGCPEGGFVGDETRYDVGFEVGFAEDDWYFDGFHDSYDTVDFGPIYYQGSDIPYVDGVSYEAGYWDGVWWAYNDGYFVSYWNAFLIGFSEGYDAAYWPDYLAFLASDRHTEYLDGGWSDGYADGFSEGRVFGAYDFETGMSFDWLDAFHDYEAGTDLYFDEVGVGTGEYGPVYLYEYGTDPLDLIELKALSPVPVGPERSVRKGLQLKDGDAPKTLYRPFREDVTTLYQFRPGTSPRAPQDLRLKSTWLDRVTVYRDTANPYLGKASSARTSSRAR